VMIDSPSVIEEKQLKELSIQVALQKAGTLSGAVK
jgi:hypothetical protein